MTDGTIRNTCNEIIKETQYCFPRLGVTPTPTGEPTPTPVNVEGYYANPLVFNISTDFAKDSMTGEVKKHVEDTVTLRNRVKRVLDVDGKYYVFKD
jgi:hypothetical protein